MKPNSLTKRLSSHVRNFRLVKLFGGVVAIFGVYLIILQLHPMFNGALEQNIFKLICSIFVAVAGIILFVIAEHKLVPCPIEEDELEAGCTWDEAKESAKDEHSSLTAGFIGGKDEYVLGPPSLG